MTERKPMSRRTFMKAALVGLAGLYVASNVPDWFLNEQYSGWFKEGLWDYADAMVRANVPDKKLQLQVNPSVRAVPYDVTLSHISAPPENNHLTVSSPFGGAIYGGKNGLANLYEAAVPNEAIFRTAGFLQEHIKGEINPPNNSGFIGVTLAAMYPERVIARKAASMEREKMLANTDPNVIPVVTFNEEGAFTWSIPNSNGGNGYIVSIS